MRRLTQPKRPQLQQHWFRGLSVGSYPHIASNYPGAGLTYVTNNLNPDNPYVLMQHQGVIQNNSYSLLSNGAWHHVTMRWDATAKTMTYSYNDKDPSTGNAQTPVGTKTVLLIRRRLIRIILATHAGDLQAQPVRTGRIIW